ncbi:MAG TPA: TPM domain-containing protein, partial [Verrucomicrobiae bacterium]|nr:TPM domain-containing protein [Verrucomicrobiae bacterium]
MAKAGGCLLLAVLCFHLSAAEIIPPAPAQYFNDYAHVVSPATAARLNQTLENFERETSNQILVAIYPKMQSDSSIEDYTVRVARAWRVGQAAKNNGAVLFVFIQDRKMFIQVGYGLEGALTDALCKRITADEISPRFKNGDYNGGLTAGVNAILAASKGEYKGTGRTVAGSRNRVNPGAIMGVIFFIIFLFVVLGAFFFG